MSFNIVLGDLFEQKYDALVIPCAPHLKLDGNLGGQALNKCGDKFKNEIKQLKNLAFTETAIINAYNIQAKKIILVANPMWIDGNHDELFNLKSCYINALEKAEDFELESIAFPLLSSGANSFSKRNAIETAIETLNDYSDDSSLNICLVINNPNLLKTYKDIFSNYNVVKESFNKELHVSLNCIKDEIAHNRRWYVHNAVEILDEADKKKNVSEKLQYFMTLKGKQALEVYIGATSKTYFYDLLKGKAKANKDVLISYSINLELDLYETNELLQCCGFILDSNIGRDICIMSCIINNFSIEDTNKALFNEKFPPIKETKDKDF